MGGHITPLADGSSTINYRHGAMASRSECQPNILIDEKNRPTTLLHKSAATYWFLTRIYGCGALALPARDKRLCD
jgi:hypothetical protein